MTPATVKISEHEDRAALTESAFAAIKCGEWNLDTFKVWVSQKHHEAYVEGLEDSRMYEDMISRVL